MWNDGGVKEKTCYLGRGHLHKLINVHEDKWGSPARQLCFKSFRIWEKGVGEIRCLCMKWKLKDKPLAFTHMWETVKHVTEGIALSEYVQFPGLMQLLKMLHFASREEKSDYHGNSFESVTYFNPHSTIWLTWFILPCYILINLIEKLANQY